MDFQSHSPRERIELILLGEDSLGIVRNVPINFLGEVFYDRVGLVDSEETISLGKLARNAPRQLIVRGTCHVVRFR